MKPNSQKKTYKTPNSRKNSTKSALQRYFVLIGVVLASLILTACGSLGAPDSPTVVGSPPTLPPATETPQPPPTTESSQPTAEPTEPTLTAIPMERVTALPDASGVLWQEFDRSLRSPTFLTHAGDGTGRTLLQPRCRSDHDLAGTEPGMAGAGDGLERSCRSSQSISEVTTWVC
ncbi:MAG: hypothetical protein ACK2T7_03225 [Anaerolineales bacterium]